MPQFLLLNFEDFNLNQDITQTIQTFNPFCICCLNRDGPMFDLEKCNHTEYLKAFDKPELKQFNQLICLHCHSILKKIQCFQAQLIQSYSILMSGELTNTTVNDKKLNSLTIQQVVNDLHLSPDLELDDAINEDIEKINKEDDFRSVQNDSNMEQNFTNNITISMNLADTIQNDTNILVEPFTNIEENVIQEQNRLSKNIKTALDILERNNQSFVSLSSQLQFLNGEHLSFLEPSLLSKEILTDIPLVPAKSLSTDLENGLLNNSKPLEIEIDGTDKIFYDGLDLSPELMGKETNAPEKMEAIVSNSKIRKEIEPKTKTSVPNPNRERKMQPSNSPIQCITRIQLTHEELDRERVQQAQSQDYLKYKFRCETCIVGFNYRENLEDHSKRKHGPREGDGVICEICSQLILNVASVTEHNYRHYTRYECERCNKRYHTHDEAAQHYGKHKCINGVTKKVLKNKRTDQLKRNKLKFKPAKVEHKQP